MTLLPSNSLPSIPSLPPLEMPEPSCISSSSLQSQKKDSSSSLRQRSLVSTTSKESFATARTSTPLATPTYSEDFPGPSQPRITHSGSSSLRKSMSVDSFVNYGRELPSRCSTRASRVNTSSAIDPPRGLKNINIARYTPTHAHDITYQDQISTPRSRGFSVSTAGESLGDEYDIEREAENHSGKRPLRPGHLILPSRPTVQPLSLYSTSSLSSLGSGPSSASPREDSRRLHSTMSLQSMAKKGSNAISGRARSGSLGVNVSNMEKRVFINTQVSIANRSELTILVIGVPGCGKSTAIHKGLKAYRLSEPVYLSAPVKSFGRPSRLNYRRRTGHLTYKNPTKEYALYVLEVDSSDLDLSSPFTFWPEGAPRIDGVVICYDASNESSYTPVEKLLVASQAQRLPFVVLACKSDLQKNVNPHKTSHTLRLHDSGLVEVTVVNSEGKDKMRRIFDWLLQAVFRDPITFWDDLHYRNPASPEFLFNPPPWELSELPPAIPTPSSSVTVMDSIISPTGTRAPQLPPVFQSSRPPDTPASPSRSRSTNDLLSDYQRSKGRHAEQDTQELSGTTSSTNAIPWRDSSPSQCLINSVDAALVETKEAKKKEPRPAQWATLDELLDKLIFLTVSGDDPAYITHFLLTYRRFATPRSVLLAMTKRMRQLDNPSGDPMFACFAQMRICALLETWIKDFPWDFAVRGTAGALSALVKAIIGKTYLLHYGSDFLPFLEMLPNLVDKDSSWAMPVDDATGDESDEYSVYEDEDSAPVAEPDSPTSSEIPGPIFNGNAVPASLPTSRERKFSLPLTTKALIMPNLTPTLSSTDSQEKSTKQLLKDLSKLSQDVLSLDSEEIAQEITRLESELFLEIEPRHWLQFTLASGKKDPHTDTIAKFNEVSNHLADWVVSLILCHDKPRGRARMVEKFVEIAQKLRGLNNYSALRAFVAGINNATYPGDPTIEMFKAKSSDAYKNFQSWDLLLQHIRSHSAYRMALRNTTGACIPALEVHMSDLIRAHEGNIDINPDDSSKIHWGKFNMMGKFITSTTRCQAQCRTTNDYSFPERPSLARQIFHEPLMDEEMQRSRITPPDISVDEPYRPSLASFPRTISRDTPSSGRDLRKIRIRPW